MNRLSLNFKLFVILLLLLFLFLSVINNYYNKIKNSIINIGIETLNILSTTTTTTTTNISSVTCDNDPIWCNVKMPEKSLFRYPAPPVDTYRWRIAQIQASRGEQVLLKKIIKHFPFYLDFIDG